MGRVPDADVERILEAVRKLDQIISGGAIVKMTTADGKETTATADGNGNFSFKDLPPGTVSVKVDASGYMVGGTSVDIRANDTSRPTIQINKRPKISLVKLQGNELKISKQVHFETDSAKILGDSNQLLSEVADAIVARAASVQIAAAL